MEILFLNQLTHVETIFLLILLGVIFLILGTYLYEYILRIIQIFGPKKRDAVLQSRDEELLKKREAMEEEAAEVVPPLTIDEIMENTEKNHDKIGENTEIDETIIDEENPKKNTIIADSDEIFTEKMEKSDEKYPPIIVSESEKNDEESSFQSEKFEESKHYAKNFSQSVAKKIEKSEVAKEKFMKKLDISAQKIDTILGKEKMGGNLLKTNDFSEKLSTISQEISENREKNGEEIVKNRENFENFGEKIAKIDAEIREKSKNTQPWEKTSSVKEDFDREKFGEKIAEKWENVESETRENWEILTTETGKFVENVAEEKMENSFASEENTEERGDEKTKKSSKTFEEIERAADEEFAGLLGEEKSGEVSENWEKEGENSSENSQQNPESQAVITEIFSEKKNPSEMKKEAEDNEEFLENEEKTSEKNKNPFEQRKIDENNKEESELMQKSEKIESEMTDEIDVSAHKKSEENAESQEEKLSESVQKSLQNTGETVAKIIDKIEPAPEHTPKEHPKNNDRIFTIVNQVKTYLARWMVDEAKMLIIEGLSLKKNHKELNLILGEIYEGEQNFESAEIIYKDIAEIYHEDVEVLRRLANLLIIKKNLVVAYEIYKKILSLGGDDENALYILSHLAREQDDMSDVYKYSREYLRQWPNNREILGLLSEAEIALGKRKEAIITLTKLKNFSPYDAHDIEMLIEKLLTEEELSDNFSS